MQTLNQKMSVVIGGNDLKILGLPLVVLGVIVLAAIANLLIGSFSLVKLAPFLPIGIVVVGAVAFLKKD
jgi:hypothetical protein